MSDPLQLRLPPGDASDAPTTQLARRVFLSRATGVSLGATLRMNSKTFCMGRLLPTIPSKEDAGRLFCNSRFSRSRRES